MEGAEETAGKDDEEEDLSDAESEDLEDESDDEEDDLDEDEGGDRDEDVEMGDDTESKDTNAASGHHQQQDIMVH